MSKDKVAKHKLLKKAPSQSGIGMTTLRQCSCGAVEEYSRIGNRMLIGYTKPVKERCPLLESED